MAERLKHRAAQSRYYYRNRDKEIARVIAYNRTPEGQATRRRYEERRSKVGRVVGVMMLRFVESFAQNFPTKEVSASEVY